MSRPLRIEFPGTVYHVTSRGDRREPIYRDGEDRTTHLEVIAQAMDRFDAQVLACCQMGNHYHAMLHTRQANLSRLMRHVNGEYTQAFNQRHAQAPLLFDGEGAYICRVCTAIVYTSIVLFSVFDRHEEHHSQRRRGSDRGCA